MNFAQAQPYAEARSAASLRALLPTSMRTAQIEELVASGHADVLARARFSAGVRSAQHLDAIESGIQDIVAGGSDLATQRLAVKQFVRSTGYLAPADERGSIVDLLSDQRIDLQLSMGVQQAQGYGYVAQASDPAIADAYPAFEFKRVESREHPREDWDARWDAARAATTAEGATDSARGVKAAVVGHPIWKALNRFGVDYEPFDYGSGMGLVSMPRRRAIELGIIDRDTRVVPNPPSFNGGLQTTPDIRSANLRSLLDRTGLGRYDDAGVFHYTGGTA